MKAIFTVPTEPSMISWKKQISKKAMATKNEVSSWYLTSLIFCFFIRIFWTAIFQSFRNSMVKSKNEIPFRGHSTTTWTEFWHFLTPPLRGQFLYPERGQKQNFLTPSPPYLLHVVIEWSQHQGQMDPLVCLKVI